MKSEQQYCVMRKELLALVTAVRHFHHYVYQRLQGVSRQWGTQVGDEL